MLSAKEAQKIVLSAGFPPGIVSLPVVESVGMVLARDIISVDDIPAYDNSGVNGFAIRSIDVKGADKSYPVRLTLLDEDIPAGKIPLSGVNPGFCMSIMTGAPIPPGADAVVIKEDTQRDASHVLVFREIMEGENVRRCGQDIKKGERILLSGTRIYPAEAGIMASMGMGEVEVCRLPVAGVLASGDELVAVDQEPEKGRVRDCNSYTISSQLKEMGLEALKYGIVRDHEESLKDGAGRALAECDLLILTGGISAGENDLVKDALQDMGATLVFWRVSQIPGKSMAFFKFREKFIFGLPGDPVAAMICFEMYVRPFIRKMMGYGELFRPAVLAKASRDFELRKGWTSFIRVFVSRKEDGLWFQSPEAAVSGRLSSMLCANGIAGFPEDMAFAKKGTPVKVFLIKEII